MVFLYPFFFAISIIFPRNKRIWVFGCCDGYTENTKYFFEYASGLNEFDCYWLANNRNEVSLLAKKGLRVVMRKSLMGYWVSSRAYISFICTGFSDVNRLLALSGVVINFWHGTPIKKIYLDSVHDLNRFGKNKVARFFSRSLLLFLNSKISMYYASNEFERDLVTSAAGIPLVRSKALGSPRYDIIRENISPDIFINYRGKFDNFILYAPTWREGACWSEGFTIGVAQYESLYASLEAINGVLVVKCHPLTNPEEIKSWGLKSSSRVMYAGDIGLNDINKLYANSDFLITDVSSSVFDYLVLKGSVVLFMPDVKSYISGDRGIYSYFSRVLIDSAVITWDELISIIRNKSLRKVDFFDSVVNEINRYKNTRSSIYNDIKINFY